MKCDVDTMEGSGGGEGGRSARETHTDAPTPAAGYNTHTHTRGRRHTYASQGTRPLIFWENLGEQKRSRVDYAKLYWYPYVSHEFEKNPCTWSRREGEYMRNFCNYYKLISIFRKRAIIRSLIIYLKEAEWHFIFQMEWMQSSRCNHVWPMTFEIE